MQMGTAAACSWVLGLLTEGAFHPEVFTLPGVAVSMLYLQDSASSMLCFLLQTVGQKYLSASTSSILLSFESVFGLLFSVWLLHEKLTVRMLIGCALMFAAAILAEWTPKRKSN
ncbi:MAG: EamA family transporter [Clostridium fessum]